MDGRNKEGALYLVGVTGSSLAGYALASKAPREAKGGRYVGLGLTVLSLGLWIANIVDAYKGGHKKA